MSKETRLSPDDPRAARASQIRDQDLDQVRLALKGMKFGEVRVIVQDGVIVQIERVEKQRLR